MEVKRKNGHDERKRGRRRRRRSEVL